jgi:hypothetical protein
VLAQGPSQQAIPSSFFGLHVNQPDGSGDSFPVLITYGNVRNWDVYSAAWPDIETNQCIAQNNCPFAWTFLDNVTSGVYQDNQAHSTSNVVEFTLGRTPGSCYPPKDLNTDGTGADQYWRDWVAAIASHVNASGYSNSHAPIKYWEIWDEFDQANFWAGAVTGQTQAVNGTTAQLVRMAEDASCIIGGVNHVTTIVMNNNETCSHVISTIPSWLIPNWPIGPTAQVIQPSISQLAAKSVNALQCFLYCGYPQGGGSGCSNDGNDHEQCAPQNSRAGADAINIIDFHHYDQGNGKSGDGNPEDNLNTSNNIRAAGVLNQTELAKPLWVGEGSWGDILQTGAWWLDPYAQGGFVPRYFATLWSQTLPLASPNNCVWSSSNTCQQSFWYGYDYDDIFPPPGFDPITIGALYCAGTLLNGGHCGSTPTYTPFLMTPQATMWNTAVGWLTGAIPNASSGNAFCNLLAGSSTVWHCDFTYSGGGNYSMVWDNSYSQNAEGNGGYCATTFPSSPYVCGQTAYTLSPQYTHWEDLSGTTYSTNWSVPLLVGLNPILLKP